MMEWKEVKLGKIAKVISGFAFKSADFIKENGIPAIKIKNIKNGNIDLSESDFVSDKFLSLNEKYHLKRNDILVSLTGSHLTQPNSVVGRIALYRHNFTSLLNQRAGKILPNENLTDRRFLYCYLSQDSIKESIAKKARGAANQANISPGDVEDTDILLPPLQTQRRIASILSAYDDLIENNLRRIKLLEELAQRTYEEWFVKFRVNGEQLVVNEETGLPVGWEKKKLGDIGVVTSSKRIFLSDYVEKGVPFYRSKEIIQKSRYENIDEPLYITSSRYDEIKAKFDYPKAGDFLITSVGTLGYVHLVNKQDGDFYFKDGNLIWIKNIKNAISTPFLLYTFRKAEFKNLLNSIAIGSSQKALTIIAVKNLDIVMPTQDLLEEYFKISNSTLEQIYNLSAQNRHLKESRDLLLPRLMSGALVVKSEE